MKKAYLFSIVILFVICLFSCKKEISFTEKKATLHFSNDTILFDTVFTTIGSITHHLKIYNNNDFDVKTNINITGEDEQFYSMNVDGISGKEAENVEIPSKDSIFIFIEVRMDPNNENSPLITNAKIEFNTAGQEQEIALVAHSSIMVS